MKIVSPLTRFSLLLVCTALAGCAQPGNLTVPGLDLTLPGVNYSHNPIRVTWLGTEYTFTMHTTTKDEVVAALGKPVAEATEPNGSVTRVVYREPPPPPASPNQSYGYQDFFAKPRNDLILAFDSNHLFFNVQTVDSSQDQYAPPDQAQADQPVQRAAPHLSHPVVSLGQEQPYLRMIALIRASHEECGWPLAPKIAARIDAEINDDLAVLGVNAQLELAGAHGTVHADFKYCVDDQNRSTYQKLIARVH